MCDRFLKLMMSKETDSLQENFPNAFLLLIQICKNARRYSDDLDGLQIGDSIIGRLETSRKSGISLKEYRNALTKLEELGFIEIVWNQKNKKQQKRAIKKAIKSTVVNVTKSTVCDLNLDEEAIKRANRGPTEGHNLRMLKNIKDIPLSKTLSPKIESIQSATGTDGLMDGFSLSINSINSSKPLDNYENATNSKLNQTQHNINYLVVYPGDIVRGFLPVKMNRTMLLKCLALPCINGSEEALRARVKEIQEAPGRTEEITDWPRWLPPEDQGGWKIYNKKSPKQEKILQSKEFAKRVIRAFPEDNLKNPYVAQEYYDDKKDQFGLLIALRNGYYEKSIPYSTENFEEIVCDILREKGFPIEYTPTKGK